MVRDDGLDMMVAQERDNPRVVRARRALVVQPAPRDFDLLPAHDLALDDIGQRDPVSPTPTGVDHALFRYRRADNHVSQAPLFWSWIATTAGLAMIAIVFHQCPTRKPELQPVAHLTPLGPHQDGLATTRLRPTEQYPW